jgi:hypothetical protein
MGYEVYQIKQNDWVWNGKRKLRKVLKIDKRDYCVLGCKHGKTAERDEPISHLTKDFRSTCAGRTIEEDWKVAGIASTRTLCAVCLHRASFAELPVCGNNHCPV